MIQLSFDFNENYFQNKSKEINGEIGDAVVAAAIELKRKARSNLRNSPYRMNNVSEGIVLGKLKKDYSKDSNPKVKIHAFGTDGSGVLARVFIGSKERPRYQWKRNGKSINPPLYTGIIKSNNAISNALDQGILDNKINSILNKDHE